MLLFFATLCNNSQDCLSAYRVGAVGAERCGVSYSCVRGDVGCLDVV